MCQHMRGAGGHCGACCNSSRGGRTASTCAPGAAPSSDGGVTPDRKVPAIEDGGHHALVCQFGGGVVRRRDPKCVGSLAAWLGISGPHGAGRRPLGQGRLGRRSQCPAARERSSCGTWARASSGCAWRMGHGGARLRGLGRGGHGPRSVRVGDSCVPRGRGARLAGLRGGPVAPGVADPPRAVWARRWPRRSRAGSMWRGLVRRCLAAGAEWARHPWAPPRRAPRRRQR